MELPQVIRSSERSVTPMATDYTNASASVVSWERKKKYLVAVAAFIVMGAIGAAIGVSSTFMTSKDDSVKEASVSTGNACTSDGCLDTDTGFLNVHLVPKDASQIMLDIPISSLNTPFIVHSTWDKGLVIDGKIEAERSNPAEDTSYQTFRFELAENGQSVHVLRENYDTRTTDEQLKYAVEEGLWPGYVTSLPILESSLYSYYVDAEIFAQQGFHVTNLGDEWEASVIQKHTRSFQENTNVLVRYQNGEVTASLFFSILRLPKLPMSARIADDRVGYFALKYTDLGVHAKVSSKQTQDIDRTVTIINRRRLELNEFGNVRNPIVYYIDPSVPERWRTYFKEGVEIWSKAFEAAGFPNAIHAILPTDANWPDDFHVGDMRYNTISIMMSESIYALGPSVVDPRSGEILHSDITFSHGWVKSWVGGIEGESPFLPATSAKSSIFRQQKNNFQCHRASIDESKMSSILSNEFLSYSLGYVPDKVVGSAFRETVMHEVGHTLGLRHNFIASGERTMEQLIDAQYTKIHGTTASVMDYVPVNIWSGITKQMAEENVFYTEVLGEYDIAAIKYGYQTVDSEIPSYKNDALDALAMAAPEFQTDEDTMSDQNPYTFRHDLSKDPIGYYLDRINVLNVLRDGMVERYMANGDSWTKAWDTERFFLGYTNYVTRNLARFIGGVRLTHAHHYVGDKAPNVTFVSEEDQMRVLEFATKVISGSLDVFPDPESYKNYLEPNGECGIGLGVYCYASKMADVEGKVQTIRQSAVGYFLQPELLMKLTTFSNDAGLSVRKLLMTVGNAVLEKPFVSSNFNTQTFFIKGLSTLSRSKDERIASEASLALAVNRAIFKDYMSSNTTDVPVDAMVHFKKCTGGFN